MKPESQNFTSEDVPHFMDELLGREMGLVADRLRAASARMEALAPRIPDERSDDESWTAKEVLAHVFVLSRAYGAFAYMVARGRVPELSFGDVISQRDTLGDEIARLPVAEIVAKAREQHERTLKFMERATLADYKASVKTEHGDISVEGLLRLPLVAHLEDHLDQIERVLAGETAATAVSG
jgi:DinB superfamily